MDSDIKYWFLYYRLQSSTACQCNDVDIKSKTLVKNILRLKNSRSKLYIRSPKDNPSLHHESIIFVKADEFM